MKVFGIEVVVAEEVGNDIFLLPSVHPKVYLRTGQNEATIEQEMAATIEAYTAAAWRGEVVVIKNVKV